MPTLFFSQSSERVAVHHQLGVGIHQGTKRKGGRGGDVADLLGRYWIYKRGQGMKLEHKFDWSNL